MVCLRNISVDTLHKGVTEDNNNNDVNLQRVVTGPWYACTRIINADTCVSGFLRVP
jgi:hypothetical protein